MLVQVARGIKYVSIIGKEQANKGRLMRRLQTKHTKEIVVQLSRVIKHYHRKGSEQTNERNLRNVLTTKGVMDKEAPVLFTGSFKTPNQYTKHS